MTKTIEYQTYLPFTNTIVEHVLTDTLTRLGISFTLTRSEGPDENGSTVHTLTATVEMDHS